MTIKNSQTRREKFLDPHLGFLVPEEPLWCLGPFAPRLSLFSFTELVDNPRKDCHARTRPKGSPSQSNNSDPKPHGSPTYVLQDDQVAEEFTRPTALGIGR
ncbi:GSCOCG00006516001-RA-CDS [Cotesia congregata]|nr:GSCOCG00006516001-RA-CDS [Cotesia congregata]